MRIFLSALAIFYLFPAGLVAADHTIAVVGLVHSHVWGHLDKMVKGQPARLVGVAETVPELVEEAKKKGVPESLIHADWKKMIDTAKPEMVWAFVENNRHLEIAEYCAARKIHILFEKPLASNFKEAQAIRELSRKHGVYVLSNYQMAWWPTQYAAKAAADSGELGEVWRVRGVVGHGGPGGPTGLNKWFFEWLTDPVKNGGGALVDFGCYNVLWSLMYLGRPESVFAYANRLRPEEFPKVEDNATMLLHYKKGVAVLEGSWDLPRSFQDVEVFGRKGSVHATREKVEVRKGKGPAEERTAPALSPENAEPIAHMIRCIETKTAPAGMVGLDINAEVVEVLDALKESLRTGRSVVLPAKK